MTNVRNTLADIMSLGGYKNANRYYQPMNTQIEMQLMQLKAMQSANQPMPTDPAVMQAQAFIQGEQIKAESKERVEMFKESLKAQQFMSDDDFRRDELDQELLIRAAEILGRWGGQVDVAAVNQAKDEPRFPSGNPMQAATGERY